MCRKVALFERKGNVTFIKSGSNFGGTVYFFKHHIRYGGIMKYIIVGDSSMDLNDELSSGMNWAHAPFRINVDGKDSIDDNNAQRDDFLSAIKKSKSVAKSAAPAPHDYTVHLSEDTECAFFISLSSKLSSSYSSALIAVQEAKEKFPRLKVHAFDSLSASAGESVIAVKIKNLIDEGKSFEEIVKETEEFIANKHLYFILDNLTTLWKNGRLKNLKGIIAMLLNIKPILAEDGKGEIKLADKAKTFSKGIDKLANHLSACKNAAERTLIIAHCNALERAEILKEKVSAAVKFKDIQIVPMKLLSSTYANEGGIVAGC